MQSESRIADLFACHRPESSIHATSDSAGLPAPYLRSWLTPEETGRPVAPPSKATLQQLAAASGADFTAVQQAFTAAWSTLQGGHWNHFAEGDRVLVFGKPDPASGSRRVRRGTVLAPPSAEIIKIGFGNEEYEELSPADPVHVSHAAGACRCVVAIS
ncbi:hypothetical protein QRX60_43435 [Amycolatopsis mongoliensis]|uniref:Uncharacterized protein n=1 Tax=Amycolatopsis mongoliensis TaxID=715475 RepID=A0A9Y2JLS8_9PSEU|nr:hypothetical protein [Amycolatopsis sp. 4-36]WIY00838.1 hypothetical protein QRX60_43435 [Amycolatopsis sp. 4-36]